VCSTCYHRALSAKGTCPVCGRIRRLLHYPGHTVTVCRDCGGAGNDHVCSGCGAEEALHRRGLCGRCVLHQRLTALLGDQSHRARVGLEGLLDALSRARSAKDTLRWLEALLDWLATRDIPLADVTQHDGDAWLAGPRPDRYVARSFVRWAIARGLMPKLEFPAGRKTAVTPAVAVTDRVALTRRLLHEEGIETRDRVAGVLVVVFAQPVIKIASLTVDDVAIDHETVAIRFGETAITLPQPLDDHLRELIIDRRDRAAAALPPPGWLFPGSSPGRPIGAQSLSRRLKRIGVDCQARRIAALVDMAGQVPAPVLADLLGIGILTATRWAEIAGRPWGDYPTLRQQ